MSYILFFIYLVLLCWLLTKIKFIQKSDLGNRIIIILFLVRIISALVNGWLCLYYYPGSDSLQFHKEGIEEYNLLFNNTREYFLNIFHNTHKSYSSGLLDVTDSYWNDLRSNIISKILSIFNIFSRGNYFINSLFYNFFIFFGSVSLYRIFSSIYTSKKLGLIISVFLLPSTLFFTSGIHRDGLIFLGLGLVLYNMYFLLKENRMNIKKVIYIFLGLTLILLLRSFVFITLIPALIAWIIAEKRGKFIFQTYLFTYLFFAALFFTSKFLGQQFNLPRYVSTRQIAFIALSKEGGSTININPLFPNSRSFFNNAPQALNHSLMRPYLTEYKTLFYIPASIEIFLYEVLFILFLVFPSDKIKSNSFIYFGLFFSLCLFLIIGYTIPIIGAIVRYRSIYFPFLLTPIMYLINYEKLKYLINKKKT